MFWIIILRGINTKQASVYQHTMASYMRHKLHLSSLCRILREYTLLYWGNLNISITFAHQRLIFHWKLTYVPCVVRFYWLWRHRSTGCLFIGFRYSYKNGIKSMPFTLYGYKCTPYLWAYSTSTKMFVSRTHCKNVNGPADYHMVSITPFCNIHGDIINNSDALSFYIWTRSSWMFFIIPDTQ